MEWPHPISPATLARQIERSRCRRRNLRPVYREDIGRMRVAESPPVVAGHGGIEGLVPGVPRYVGHHGIAGIVYEPAREVCSVDDDHPLSAAGFNRIGNGEVDLAARARAADAANRRQVESEDAELDREIAAWWRERKRIRIVSADGVMQTHDNRASRRAARARARRRG